MVVYLKKLCYTILCVGVLSVTFESKGEVLLSRELLAVIKASQHQGYFRVRGVEVPAWEVLQPYAGVRLQLESLGTGHLCQLTQKYHFSVIGVLNPKAQAQIILKVKKAPVSSGICGVGRLFVFEGDLRETFRQTKRLALLRRVEGFLDKRSGLSIQGSSYLPLIGDIYAEVLNLPFRYGSSFALPFLTRCRIVRNSKLSVRGKLSPTDASVVVEVMETPKAYQDGDVYPACPKRTLALVGEGLLEEFRFVLNRAVKSSQVSDVHITQALNEAKVMPDDRWVLKINKEAYGYPCILKQHAKTWKARYETFMVVSNPSDDSAACKPRDRVIGLAPTH